MSTVGGGGANAAVNSGRIFIRLKPRNERKPHADEIIKSCAPSWRRFPASTSICRILPPIRIGGQLTKSQYQYTLQSPDTDELYQYAPKLEKQPARPAAAAGRHQRPADQEPAGHRRYRPRQGVGARTSPRSQIEDALYSAYGSRQISTIYAPNNQYQVIMELLPQYQRDPSALSHALCPLQDRTAGAAGRAWPA